MQIAIILNWHDSRPYKSTGLHLVVISSKITSSIPKFRTFTKNTVDCITKVALRIGKWAFKVTRFDYKINIPKYHNSLTLLSICLTSDYYFVQRHHSQKCNTKDRSHNGRERYCVLPLAAAALLDHGHHGCPRCFFPREKLHPSVKFMPAAGAYTWRP